MGKKLTTLCELQLFSILQEVDASTAATSGAAHHAMQSCQNLESIIAEGGGNGGRKPGMLEAVAAVKRELNNIIISMQFHDELAQRVSHVLQLFAMLKNTLPAGTGELDDDAELLKIATRIFSIQAEFAVLNKLFPDSGVPQSGADTELF